MGSMLSRNDIKLGTTKIEISRTYEFEIFFLQIILNNPKFALYLLNLDEKIDKRKISLKNLANKLFIELILTIKTQFDIISPFIPIFTP